jgi:hypothetical protein
MERSGGPRRGSFVASCWSCNYYEVALLVDGRYGAGPGFSNRRTRHPTDDLPWWGVSDKALDRRNHGRVARGGFGMKPPVVVTCFCGADNRVEIAGVSV